MSITAQWEREIDAGRRASLPPGAELGVRFARMLEGVEDGTLDSVMAQLRVIRTTHLPAPSNPCYR